MQFEFDALIRNKMLDLVHLPFDANFIRSIWILRHKKNPNGSFKLYKACLVGDDRSQVADVDCDENLSPVVKPVICI